MADRARHVPILLHLRRLPLVETSRVHRVPAFQYATILFGDPLAANAARVACRAKLLEVLDFNFERLDRRSRRTDSKSPTVKCGHLRTLSLVTLLKCVPDGSRHAGLARSRKGLTDALAVWEHVKRFVFLQKRI